MAAVSFTCETLKYEANSAKAAWWLPLVDVDQELSIPSIYSALLYFIMAAILGSISKIKIGQHDPCTWQWILLSIISCMLGFDEGSAIHERLVVPMNTLMHGDLPGFLHFAWIIPFLFILVLFVLAYWKFYWALPVRTRVFLLISAAILVFGAIGMEMISGNYASVYGIKNIGYNILTTIEESLEMIGLISAIFTFWITSEKIL
jgi:hypothetical protein